MNFDLPHEIKSIIETTKHFATVEIVPNINAFEASGQFPYSLIKKMGEAGFFGAAFPEELGGTNAGFLAIAAISEEISRISPEFGYAMNMQAMTCPFTIYNWGTEEQISRYVPDLISGKKIGMFALSEPGGGSDAAGAMQTKAIRDGDVYRLNGSKQWITFADVCDTGILFAKTDPSAGYRGITAFIVEPKVYQGFTAKPISMSGLSNVLCSNSVYLDDFVVPVMNRIGNEGEGFKIAMNALEYGRLTVSARSVGLAQACFEHSINYANERVIRGKPIGHYQMIQHLIADMAVNIDAARLLVERTGSLMDQGKKSSRATSRAKYAGVNAAKHAAASAAEIFAGYALADEYPIKKFTAYVNMLAVGEGTPNVQRVLIAEDALGTKDANRHPIRNRLRN
ncbi:MAG: acyl-CoA dehydrogenase family protein [Alphaproteobacteria bacterium]|jgi:isovaleryl-CoA dehydrogenase|nr:acyl-CoA dehydrogenase family protein [Alphaproteobacteria bacterium]